MAASLIYIAKMYKRETLYTESLDIFTTAMWSNLEYIDRLALSYVYMYTYQVLWWCT